MTILWALRNGEKQSELIRAWRKENGREWRKKWVRDNPEKYSAIRAVERALQSGRIIRPTTCSRCGSRCKPEAHHSDYSKKLDMLWLCRSCHCETHRESRVFPEPTNHRERWNAKRRAMRQTQKKGGVCLMEEDYEAYAALLDRIFWWATGLRQNAHFRSWYASTMNYFMRGRSVVEQLESFAKRSEEIQSKCCCHSWDAHECYRMRYPSDEDDPDYSRCECVCHSEIAEEEDSQEWP